MTRGPRTRLRVGIVATLVTLLLAGVVAAYWSGTGSGSTRTRLGDPKALVFGPGTASPELYPGGDADVAVVASNANPYAVHVRSLILDTGAGSGGFAVDASHAGCDVSALAFVSQDNGGKGWTVPPKTGTTDGTLSIDLTGALLMSAGAASACQDAVFTVGLEARS